MTLNASGGAHPISKEPVFGRGLHVVFIDDEASICKAMERVLVLLGYRCTSFSDPRVALDAFRNNPDQFDAVISDMSMPNLSGVDIARAVSAIRPNLPIVLTSGRNEEDMERPSDSEGVHAWLSKPATIDEIGNLLSVILAGGTGNPGIGVEATG